MKLTITDSSDPTLNGEWQYNLYHSSLECNDESSASRSVIIVIVRPEPIEPEPK